MQWVDTAATDALGRMASGFLRDEAPPVRKAMRRLLRAWCKTDPAGLSAWADEVRGGIPKLLQPDIDAARRKTRAKG